MWHRGSMSENKPLLNWHGLTGVLQSCRREREMTSGGGGGLATYTPPAIKRRRRLGSAHEGITCVQCCMSCFGCESVVSLDSVREAAGYRFQQQHRIDALKRVSLVHSDALVPSFIFELI